MSIMAKYAQIIWAEPTNQDVQDRNRAVATLSALIARMSTREAVALADTIAGGFSGEELPESTARQVEEAISAESAAFVLKGRELQAQVCLAVAALAVVQGPISDGGWAVADALAASLWSALTLQDQVEQAKLEELRQDLIGTCRMRVADVAKAARKRVHVPDVGTLTISENDPAGGRANNAYKRATAPVIAALKQNQELDREEIDFLWWVVADYSDLLGCPLAEREPFTRAVASGLEGATMLRRLPSDGFRHAVLRRTGGSERKSIADLIAAVGDQREKLGASLAGSWATGHRRVFPLISSLVADGSLPGTAVELDARGWGARALLEATIVAMEDTSAGVA